jgi:hypothetical protein
VLNSVLMLQLSVVDRLKLPESAIPTQMLRNFIKRGIENVVQVFESLACMTEHDAEPRVVMEELDSAVNSGKIFGWDPWEKELLQLQPPMGKKKNLVLDSFSAKVHAINLAIEVTNSIIRVNGIIHSS